jgi:hypothetical protein
MSSYPSCLSFGVLQERRATPLLAVARFMSRRRRLVLLFQLSQFLS